MPMPWFRLYSELLSDRKLAYVASACGLPKVFVLGFWTGLLCLANDSPERGAILLAPGMPMDAVAIGGAVGIDGTTAGIILDSLMEVGMVSQSDGCFGISKWHDRQFVSDDVTPRVQKCRDGKRSSNVTPIVPCNAPDQNRSEQIIPDADADLGAAAPTVDLELGKVQTAWQSARGGATTAYDLEQITGMVDDYTAEWVLEAIAEANKSKQDRLPSLRFLEVILQRWKREGFKAPFDAKKKREESMVKEGQEEQRAKLKRECDLWALQHPKEDKPDG